jgi:hypothetical protein
MEQCQVLFARCLFVASTLQKFSSRIYQMMSLNRSNIVISSQQGCTASSPYSDVKIFEASFLLGKITLLIHNETLIWHLPNIVIGRVKLLKCNWQILQLAVNLLKSNSFLYCMCRKVLPTFSRKCLKMDKFWKSFNLPNYLARTVRPLPLLSSVLETNFSRRHFCEV